MLLEFFYKIYTRCFVECIRSPVVFEGQTFSCVESAFQAAKCIQPEDREPFTTLDGYKAKKAGRRVKGCGYHDLIRDSL